MARRISFNRLKKAALLGSSDTTRAIAGRKAKRAGSECEARLAMMHSDYEACGRATIHQLHCPTVMVGKYGTCKIIGSAPVDFMGTMKGGRSVVMEAKSSLVRKPSLSISESGVSVEQLERLRQHADKGAAVAIVWYNGGQVGVLVLSSQSIDAMLTAYGTKRGSKSIQADMFKWIDGWDWLAVVEMVGGMK